MEFSDEFKLTWWLILLGTTIIICTWRLCAGLSNNFDCGIFVFLMFLLLFPIINEFSFGGISIKKDLEKATNEIKSQINEIKNNINIQNYFSPEASKAKVKDYEEKIVKENIANVLEKKELDIKAGKLFKLEESEFRKTLKIEETVMNELQEKYGDLFKSKMQLKDKLSKRKLVVDGLIFNENKSIKEIVEIKAIKGYQTFFYTAMNFLKKTFKLGLEIPIRFIVVSEDMNLDIAENLKNQINHLKTIRKFNSKVSSINISFYCVDRVSNKLIEIILNNKK
jgi:hypothetical protein